MATVLHELASNGKKGDVGWAIVQCVKFLQGQMQRNLRTHFEFFEREPTSA